MEDICDSNVSRGVGNGCFTGCGDQRAIAHRSRRVDCIISVARAVADMVRKGAGAQRDTVDGETGEGVPGINRGDSGAHASGASLENESGRSHRRNPPDRPTPGNGTDKKTSWLIEERLNILLIAMLIAVLGMLFWIYSTIQVNTKAILEVQDKQFKQLLDLEQAQYESYKQQRDQDFKEFKAGTIALLDSNLNKIRNNEDYIRSTLDAQLAKQSDKVDASVKTIDEAAKRVESTPPVVVEKHTIEHHTEVISDSELRRREKAKAQWSKYIQDKADWQQKYGKKKH
jgi:hypothetical protein